MPPLVLFPATHDAATVPVEWAGTKLCQHGECEQILSSFWDHFCCLGKSPLKFGNSLWISINHPQGKCFCSCVACLDENIAGERAALAGMEVPSGKSVPCSWTLELSRLAILCLFPKHTHLFAFPKWSCFNILPQSRAICLAVCPSVYLVMINSLLPRSDQNIASPLLPFWSSALMVQFYIPLCFHTHLSIAPVKTSAFCSACLMCFHLLLFVQILWLTWMLSVSVWILDSIPLIWANIFPVRAAVHQLLSTHCLSLPPELHFHCPSSCRCSPNYHGFESLTLLAFAEVFEIENTIKKPDSFLESY